MRYDGVMKVLLIDNGARTLARLRRLIPGREVVRRWNADLSDHHRFDLIVLSGGSLFGVPSMKFEREARMLQETRTPVIGICLGHQIIAHAFKGTVEEMPHREKGIADVHVTTPHPIFGEKRHFSVYETHTYAVKNAGTCTTLARSNHCIAAITHPTRPVFGFQFHPEHHMDKQFGDEVFLNVLRHWRLWQSG